MTQIQPDNPDKEQTGGDSQMEQVLRKLEKIEDMIERLPLVVAELADAGGLGSDNTG